MTSIFQFGTILTLILPLLLSFICDQPVSDSQAEQTALADSLVTVVDRAMSAVGDERYPDFLDLIDPSERPELERMVAQHGYSSLRAYLDLKMHGWPYTDTLTVHDFVYDDRHARITFTGEGSSFSGRPTVRYTIVMLRNTDQGWRLVAMTSLEKEEEDRYGNPLTCHETDLPSKLRFPRPI